MSKTAELRHISRLKYWPLKAVLTEKYLIPEEEAESLRLFLEPMLQLDPNKRLTAEQMLNDKWIDGIVVAGEYELEETRRRNGGQDVGLNDEDRDALKPVADTTGLEDIPSSAKPKASMEE